MNRRSFLITMLTLFICSMTGAQSEEETPTHIIAAVQRAFPQLADAQGWSHTRLTDVRTTALGCRPMRGLELPQAIEVYRVQVTDKDQQVVLNVSADGSMTQQCANGGTDSNTGLIGTSISSERDRDGDSLADTVDNCPGIAGLPGAPRPGCPHASRGDRDGDGTANSVDACPRQAGSVAADGCSLFVDEDSDGVPDSEDICPRDFGVILADFALGCPADGSGSSSRRRVSDESCAFRDSGVPLYNGPTLASSLIGTVGAVGAEVIGRDATGIWFQVQRGWVPGSAVELRGACFNIPLVNVTAGAGTGCYLRPLKTTVNVRRAPRDKQVSQISSENSYAVLGQNLPGDWLFFRQGWVSRSALELSGDCARLPILDPAKVSSGTVHFCPPLYQGFLSPRIDVGKASAQVASRTIANRLRARPELGAEQIGEIQPRQFVDAVLDGPACDGAFVWWHVEVDGLIGWTVESDRNANVYYLEPAPTPVNQQSGTVQDGLHMTTGQSSESVNTTSLAIISSANLNRLDTIHVLPADEPGQLAWSPGNQSLAVLGAGGDLQSYSYPDFKPLPVRLGLANDFQANAIAFNMDDNLAIGSNDGRVVLVKLDEGASVSRMMHLSPTLSGPVQALAWSSDGSRLAAASGGRTSKLAGRVGELIVWGVDDPADDLGADSLHHFAYPYPLTDIAFSADDRWLAVSGESLTNGRAALWIYDATDGRLVFSKALVGMTGKGLVRASPMAAPGDFVYSNGDSLYLVDLDSGQDLRFYHRAGAYLPELTVRRRVVNGAEVLLAIGSQDANGQEQLHLVNALNSDSPALHLPVALDDLAFSPDGRAIALAQRAQDRVLILAVAAE